MSSKVVIVGAGVGGLTCAVDLATRGYRVEVLERAPAPGGKVSNALLSGVPVAAGPTVLTMPWVFDELFDAAGASFRAEVMLERATILARHAWTDGQTLDLHADRERSADAIGRVFGAGEARNFLAFCEDGRRIFEVAEQPFFRAQKLTMSRLWKQLGRASLSSLSSLTSLSRLDGHRSMWRALEQRFESTRLRQLFGRYATYVGSSPYDAPATLNVIAHVEAEGVYRTKGGIGDVILALMRLCARLGVEVRMEQDVTRVVVEGSRVVGVIAAEELHAADAVVWNGDASALGAGLVGPEAARATSVTAPDERSLSAMTWMMLGRPQGFPLVHHNVFFSDDYAAEFDAMFRARRTPEQPTVYVCAQDRGDVGTADAAPHAERLLVLINAPATGDDPSAWGAPERARATSAMTKLIERAGLSLSPMESLERTPAEFAARFPGTGGALYGPRSKGALSAMSRAGAVTKIARLYLAGGSVHPGAGVPMAALSGRLAAEQVAVDLASS